MMISTSGRSRRASATRPSISWRERVLAVNSTTPRLMIVRCQPTQGQPAGAQALALEALHRPRVAAPEGAFLLLVVVEPEGYGCCGSLARA